MEINILHKHYGILILFSFSNKEIIYVYTFVHSCFCIYVDLLCLKPLKQQNGMVLNHHSIMMWQPIGGKLLFKAIFTKSPPYYVAALRQALYQ